MSLVLPLLRLLLLFVNVYETFKTLRPPGGGGRSGQPSIRAVSQRKRDMKGCMTVWLLWCCCTMFERNCDPIFGFVVPFYSEMKSVVYLFQLITRARGAEPIYLHVIRPLIKPYAATLDVTLGTATLIGDFVMLVLWLPVQMVLDWWYPQPEAPVQQSTEGPTPTNGAVKPNGTRVPSGSKTGLPTRVPSGSGSAAIRSQAAENAVGTRTRRAGTNTNLGAQTSRKSSGSGVPHSNGTSHGAPSLHGRTSSGSLKSTQKKYEIWQPPSRQANGQADTTSRPSSGRRNVSDPVTTVNRTASNAPAPSESDPQLGNVSTDDWRKYEPFPSAYPTTPWKPPPPKPATEAVDGAVLTSVSEHVVRDSNGVVVAEVEEWRRYLPFPSAYPATPHKVEVTNSGSAPPDLDTITESSVKEAPPTRVKVARPAAGKAQTHARASSSQSLPSRRGRGVSSASATGSLNGRTAQRVKREDVDSDTNSAEQDFGQPRETIDVGGSDSRGQGSGERVKKRRFVLEEVEEDAAQKGDNDEDDIMDEDDEDVVNADDIDIGLTDGEDTMVDDSLLDDDSPKTASLLEFGAKDEKGKKKTAAHTTGQIRTTGVTNSTTVRQGRGRGASTVGVRVSRGASQSSLSSNRGAARTISQSSVYSSLSATNSLYTPVSREPSTNSLGAGSNASNGSSSYSNGGAASDFTDAPGMGSFIGSGAFVTRSASGSKRPRAQMVLENRSRLRSKASSDGSGGVETVQEEEEEVEAVEAAEVAANPHMKKRRVGSGAGAGTGVSSLNSKGKGEMLPPVGVPEGRGKKLF